MCRIRIIVYRYGDQGIAYLALLLKRVNAQFRDVVITGVGIQFTQKKQVVCLIPGLSFREHSAVAKEIALLLPV